MDNRMRGLIAAILILVGFFFWPLLLLGGVMAFATYEEFRDAPKKAQARALVEEAERLPMTVEEMRWLCESPAEEAFLDAMVAGHKLEPGPRCLQGEDIQLRSQVPLGRIVTRGLGPRHEFRGDFLVDDWLVVEIDGEKWHGSPEAKQRDAERDKIISADGYRVLRIPARIALNSPEMAIRQVAAERSRRDAG